MPVTNPANSTRIFHGTLIHAPAPSVISILPSALIVVSPDGKISHLLPSVPSDDLEAAIKTLDIPTRGNRKVIILHPQSFLIPGFIDTHNHAPQWLQRGLGQGMHILDWLSSITFPNEAKFAQPEYARRGYNLLVKGMLKQGVTTACYYSSLHASATCTLASTCLEMGQRAFVGKCNMDRDSPSYYREASAQESLRATQECILHITSADPRGDFIRPVLTPRFAISCTDELLRGLGDMAQRSPEMAIQTHFCEAQQEIDYTLSLFPQFSNEADLYTHFHLLTSRSILAHCTILTAYELQALGERQCGVAHCPTANMTVGGGFMAAPVREFLRRGMKVGLGTDSGGGFSSSMLDAMRHSLIASFARDGLYEKGNAELRKDGAAGRAEPSTGLTTEDVFYMATLGGARVVGREDELGSFEVGKHFDALVVDMSPERGGINAPLEDCDDARTVFDKFIMTGDDRNIVEVFVAGRKVHSI